MAREHRLEDVSDNRHIPERQRHMFISTRAAVATLQELSLYSASEYDARLFKGLPQC